MAKKTKKLKKEASRKQRRRKEIAELREQIKKDIAEDKRLIAKKQDKKADAKTDARAEYLADKIDALRSRIKRNKEKLEEKQKVRKRLKRRIRRIYAIIRKRVARRSYWASEHFRFSEFDCNDGTKLPKNARPYIREWCKKVGEPARARFGSVHINSAYRHRTYNARIGGVSNSVHIYDYPGRNGRGAAVDFRCASGSAYDWYLFTHGKADGRGRYSTFHHADLRNRLGWPDATWSG